MDRCGAASGPQGQGAGAVSGGQMRKSKIKGLPADLGAVRAVAGQAPAAGLGVVQMAEAEFRRPGKAEFERGSVELPALLVLTVEEDPMVRHDFSDGRAWAVSAEAARRLMVEAFDEALESEAASLPAAEMLRGEGDDWNRPRLGNRMGHILAERAATTAAAKWEREDCPLGMDQVSGEFRSESMERGKPPSSAEMGQSALVLRIFLKSGRGDEAEAVLAVAAGGLGLGLDELLELPCAGVERSFVGASIGMWAAAAAAWRERSEIEGALEAPARRRGFGGL